MSESITIGNVTFDLEEHTNNGYPASTSYTVEAFPSIVGKVFWEEFQEDFNPRTDMSNVGTMAVHYDGYDLGDEDIADIEFETECSKCEGDGDNHDLWVVGIHATAEKLRTGSQEDCQEWLDKQPDVESGRYYIEPYGHCPECKGEGVIRLHPVEYFKQEHGARVVLPLSIYEHSGMTMFVGHQDFTFDPGGWDTSYVGFIYDTPAGVSDCLGKSTDEEIEAALRDEVKLYASYLEGDVTGFDVEDDETGFIEACSGYLGDWGDEAKKEMLSAMETAIQRHIAELQERAYWNARDVTTEAA